MDASQLPAVNATLNALSAILLTLGYLSIRRRNKTVHKRLMLSACTTSSLFLISYLTYHALEGSTAFTGSGPIRAVYFAILISHVILAVIIVPMAIMIVSRALKGDFARHARLARVTLPLWLYVSVTGVVIYMMLYQMDFGP